MNLNDVLAQKNGKPEPTKKFWMGSTPEKCDICEKKLTTSFIDGATTSGPWAMMCPTCHRLYGRGLGTGYGQKYMKQDDGRWLKVSK